jgi:signal transduction histidine kinase
VIATVPFAFLLGLLRTRLSEADLVAEENVRLDAELQARLDQLQESRARIVEAGYSARRKLERDLHDGAQQRLVGLALDLRLARERLDDDPAAAGAMLDDASAELAKATEELRELARGIHPAILSDRGLEAAVESLAQRAPLPVEIDASVDGRLPEPVEAAAYFVVSEALTNVVRHSGADRAEVGIRRDNGRLVIEVADDGSGGADAAGSGLRGLADRVAALDGRLRVDDPAGGGTIVRADIPLGDGNGTG